MRVQLRFSLDTENDEDIISYLDTLSPHSKIKLFRDLVRQHIIGNKETVIDKLNKIIGITQRIENSRSVLVPSAWNDDTIKIPSSETSVYPEKDTYIDYDTGEMLEALDNLGK